jgi:hypothetical protein
MNIRNLKEDFCNMYSLYHFAFWFPLLFATPLFVGLHNINSMQVSVLNLVTTLSVICLTVSLLSIFISRQFGVFLNKLISISCLALSLILVVQGSFIHELFNYGAFNGQDMELGSYGWVYWLELMIYIGACPIILIILIKSKNISLLLPVGVLLLSSSHIFSSVISFKGIDQKESDKSFDDSVFEFSSVSNLIHIIPDGLQADVAKEVLEQNIELKKKFKDFIFFDNHSAQFQGTAPTRPTMYSGTTFDIENGFSFDKVIKSMEDSSYQNILKDNGYDVDFVSLGVPYCTKNADSCVVRGFNDLKSRGYYEYSSKVYFYQLLADLSIFRHVPMFVKDRMYENGRWFFSGSNADGTSLYPDPVIREWGERITISKEKKYKSYHFIGAHIPPQWDKDCKLIPELEKNRENYANQTYCILDSLANFMLTLKEKNIYDNTAIVITADHGNNTEAYDLSGRKNSNLFHKRFIGHARPTFMIKEYDSREELQYSTKPSQMTDIAPTVLDLVGIPSFYEGRSVMDPGFQGRKRAYYFYEQKDFWGGGPIRYVKYNISGDVKKYDSWSVGKVFTPKKAPSSYSSDDFDHLLSFSKGLVSSGGNNIFINGRAFSMLISKPDRPSNNLVLTLTVDKVHDNERLFYTINNEGKKSVVISSNQEALSTIVIPVSYSNLLPHNNSVIFEFKNSHYDSGGSLESRNLRIENVAFQ